MKPSKIVSFSGGPLHGTTKEIAADMTVYKHEQPPLPEDLHGGEVTVGFFPPFHEYVYEEMPAGSGNFVYKEQHRL